MTRLARPLPLTAVLTILYVAFALLRGLDHDESQYVAAAVLSAEGLIPYRDYAYLQTPLQPFMFAPVAWTFGGWSWPALRVVNALLGVVVVAASWRAMREAGVDERMAGLCAGLLAACDILLFSAGTARNDALPGAMLACALIPMLRADRGAGSRGAAMLTGMLLGCAAAAKVSYAVPAAIYGVYALFVPRHRPGWVALGALPPIGLVLASAALAPTGFLFGTLIFPAAAPDEYYAAAGKLWKLGVAAKAVDMLKFLALGPALLALVAVAIAPGRRRLGLLDWMIVAGLLAALLPTPTWRQYLLPMLPPLFLAVALAWQVRPPGRAIRIACVVFACAGLAPTVDALVRPDSLASAMHESVAIRGALDATGVSGPIATLSPQFVPATGRTIDPRFATGPFYFRSRGLLDPWTESTVRVVAQQTIARHFALAPPAAILIGGEGGWTSGDDRLDALLESWARRHEWRRVRASSSHLRLYLPPQAATISAAPPSIAVR